MAKTGYGYPFLFDPAALKSDEPFDTSRAWWAMLNVMHMQDVYPQYRIHTFMDIFGGVPASGTGILRWSHEFPISLKPDGIPCGLDVNVGVVTAAGSLDVAARVVRPNVAAPGTFADSIGSGQLTGTSTSTTGDVPIDGLIMFDSSNTPILGLTKVAGIDGDMSGPRSSTYEQRLRFEVEINATAAPGTIFGINYVMVREFMA